MEFHLDIMTNLRWLTDWPAHAVKARTSLLAAYIFLCTCNLRLVAVTSSGWKVMLGVRFYAYYNLASLTGVLIDTKALMLYLLATGIKRVEKCLRLLFLKGFCLLKLSS